MRKFINNPEQYALETMEGFLAVAGDGLEKLDDTLAIYRTDMPDKVAVVSGGGSGHEPAWLEYIGLGFADAICEGDIFAAPPPATIVKAAKAVERGRGVLLVYSNYSGDKLNFDLAGERLTAAGIENRAVRIADDISSAPLSERDQRRGIAGVFFSSKIAGAASQEIADLDELADIVQRAADRTRSIAVASGSGTVPGKDEPTFTLPEGLMEIGMGNHGEAGVRRSEMLSADETTDQMIELLEQDRPLPAGSRVVVLVNGLGATTRAEILIVSRRVSQVLEAKGLEIHDFITGEYTTSQEMHGFSITLFELDEHLQRYYDAPGRTTFFNNGHAPVSHGAA
ncbi:dihydroxyacetone kinase subunit DhaK [Microbacterium aerolatum]|uniref:Dihydroxyacetone kinase subunit DhaK n=1 Tax=Microbacterium aerolatum TaxID=153731 RepID=A0A511AI82_9MICO|nr:dihydroxyacetone kinase subunit DhaK [Microbacterium aerolatum]GEK85677.1 dihydroxyacetone kinase subunit DhaK [Microbacterium aerolatum]GGB21258.1 dihydroxyacetone kinase subunit DhaK [Microbacterium aerolatum]